MIDQRYISGNRGGFGDRRLGLAPIAAIFTAFVVVFAVVFIALNEDLFPTQQVYLLPWVIGTGFAIALPCVYVWYQGNFSFFHPIVLAAWSYFAPAFVLGGLILCTGIHQPYYSAFIQDPKTDLPNTFVVVSLGFWGLSLGYLFGGGNRVGDKIFQYLPSWEWSDDKTVPAGVGLLFLGMFNTIFGFFVGILGYQRVDQIGRFDGIVFLFTLFLSQASFLLWMLLFRRSIIDSKAVILTALLLTVGFARAFFAGNRGGLLTFFTMIILAYIAAGKKITMKKAFGGGAVLFVALLVGMIYGSTFRQIKGSEERVGMEQYTDVVFKTFDQVLDGSGQTNLVAGFSSLAERIEIVSSLAVVVSNHERLAPQEQQYELDNNIVKDISTFFIPRVFWTEKPVASDPHRYSDLYFNYADNAFAITPMGDLVRNFGMIGVPIGMFVLGFLLRVIFSAFYDGKPFSYWRSMFCFMLVTSVSYEGFYGPVIPYFFKVGFFVLVGTLFMHFLIRKVF